MKTLAVMKMGPGKKWVPEPLALTRPCDRSRPRHREQHTGPARGCCKLTALEQTMSIWQGPRGFAIIGCETARAGSPGRVKARERALRYDPSDFLFSGILLRSHERLGKCLITSASSSRISKERLASTRTCWRRSASGSWGSLEPARAKAGS